MKNVVAVVVLALLVACAKPLSEKDMHFVGLWKSHQTSLLITASGRLEYSSQKGAVNTSISMPIKSISGSEIVAGVLFFQSSFTLAGPPTEENGISILVVDGETLYGADEMGRVPQVIEARVVTPKCAAIPMRTVIPANAGIQQSSTGSAIRGRMDPGSRYACPG